MKKSIETLQAITTKNESTKKAVSNAIQRITDTKMTDRAEKLLVSFCVTASDYSDTFDSAITLKNVYAVEKASKIVKALKNKSASYIDKYTNAIVHNMLKRTKHKNLSNREQNASLCAALECDTMSATMQKLHKAESTASTQSSSSRVALAALNIAEYDKEAKESHINASEQALAFLEVYKK